MPHDTLVEFTRTTPGYEWLNQFGRRAAEQILSHRDPEAVVVGHADWYAGNTTVADGKLVGTEAERRTAAGAAAWICAFHARWQVALLDHDLALSW